MGYSTDFYGKIEIDPPLSQEEIEFLTNFSETRRCERRKGPYFVGGTLNGNDEDVIDANKPPKGQPGLYCQWVPTEEGGAIEWDGNEKFYEAEQWMKYIIDHFLCLEPLARLVDEENFNFLVGHQCDGEIEAEGEDADDKWLLVVRDNEVYVKTAVITYDNESLVEVAPEIERMNCRIRHLKDDKECNKCSKRFECFTE
jgi:hypothetical protein